jgi:hypothetical protein
VVKGGDYNRDFLLTIKLMMILEDLKQIVPLTGIFPLFIYLFIYLIKHHQLKFVSAFVLHCTGILLPLGWI